MAKAICFDMDGTIANLYQVEGWKHMLDASNSQAYMMAEPLYNMIELRAILIDLQAAGWDIRVIAWGSKHSTKCFLEETKVAKTEWLDAHQFPYNGIHCIQHGASKARALNYKYEIGILIDDNEEVRKKWNLGLAVHPDDNLLEFLRALI